MAGCLYNGKVIEPEKVRADWPATRPSYFFTAGGEQMPCGVSYIGPSVILTAAHCVGEKSKKIAVVLTGDGDPLVTPCDVPEAYSAHPGTQRDRKIFMDIALCYPPLPLNIDKYETISLRTSDIPSINSKVIVTGFGCSDIYSKEFDRFFRTGVARVSSKLVDGESAIELRGSQTIGQDAIICSGDSGSAVYVQEASGRRRAIIGINSTTISDGRDTTLTAAGGQNNDAEILLGLSYTTVVASPEVEKYIRDSLAAHRLSAGACIYGETTTLLSCR